MRYALNRRYEVIFLVTGEHRQHIRLVALIVPMRAVWFSAFPAFLLYSLLERSLVSIPKSQSHHSVLVWVKAYVKEFSYIYNSFYLQGCIVPLLRKLRHLWLNWWTIFEEGRKGPIFDSSRGGSYLGICLYRFRNIYHHSSPCHVTIQSLPIIPSPRAPIQQYWITSDSS